MKTDFRGARREIADNNTMAFKQTFSREKLQGLAEEHRLQQLAAFIDNHVANGVIGSATQGKTSFLFERPESPIAAHLIRSREPTDEELMIGLCEKFPGCTIGVLEEWVDVPHCRGRGQPTRILKRGIKIDWS